MSSEDLETMDTAVDAYMSPIRSVLFVDDAFPTFAASGREKERAEALWAACRDRGWICDVDNNTDWSSELQRKRILSSDLLVLDYHLAESDPLPALKVIEGLATSPSPALVIVYTAESNLDDVLNYVASFARGVDRTLVESDLDELADLEGTIEWSIDSFRSHLQAGRAWMKDFIQACKDNDIDHVVHADKGRALIEKALFTKFSAPKVERIRRIDGLGSGSDARWVQCENLFVAIIGKPTHVGSNEAKNLFDGFRAAIQAWKPSWLACLIAKSRREIEEGAFRDDLVLPNTALQKGLLYYVKSAADEEERISRARHVASDLLRRRFEHAAARMGESVRRRAEAGDPGSMVPSSADIGVDALMHANAFLCAERHDRHHLRIGTVFKNETGSHFWVCVTPACDMVPRARNPNIDPWGARLGDARAFTALQLDLNVKNSTAIGRAEQGRYIFFEDFSGSTREPKAALAFNVVTNDANPKLEYMFALGLGRKSNDGRVQLLRLSGSNGKLELQEETAVVVCQLRAPYAERLTHIVGGHVSRVGVDFMSSQNIEDE